MSPAIAAWPPDFFKPRRRPAESRPLREEPPAFLCAIELLSQISRFTYTDSVKESSHFFLLLLGLGSRFLAGRGLGRGLFRLGRFGGLGLDVAFRLRLGPAQGHGGQQEEGRGEDVEPFCGREAAFCAAGSPRAKSRAKA